MSQDLYHGMDAPIPTMAWAKEYGLLKAIAALWDVSLTPGSNNSEQKLGKGEVQHGGAICAHDTDTNQATLADGTAQGAPKVNTRRPFNPENWVFRPHYAMNENGKDGTWDVRLVAEHENDQATRGQHGTILVNEKDDQNWGWLNDIAWVRVIKGGTPVTDEEIQFNGAGFLSALYGPNGGGGSSKRGAVATPTCRNGGFVTDGVNDGQWNQAGRLVIGPAEPDASDGSGGGGTTAGDPTNDTVAGNPFGINAGVYGQNGPNGSGSAEDVQVGNPFNNGAGRYGGSGQTQSGNPFGIGAGRIGRV